MWKQYPVYVKEPLALCTVKKRNEEENWRKKLKKIFFSIFKISLRLILIKRHCWVRCDWNFDNEREKPVVSKKKLTIEDFVSFFTGSRYITHNLMRNGTIDFRHFKQDYSPGVRVVVNTCNILWLFQGTVVIIRSQSSF